MGNLKSFGGPLPISWHIDQAELQSLILQRYRELGINYALPAFAGFVPNQFRRFFLLILKFQILLIKLNSLFIKKAFIQKRISQMLPIGSE
jgi:hypothetical protein